MKRQQQLRVPPLIALLLLIGSVALGQEASAPSVLPVPTATAAAEEVRPALDLTSLSTNVMRGVAQEPSRQQLEEMLDPEHTVLLVHEVLKAFVSKNGWFDTRGRRIDVTDIMDPMVKLVAAARASDVRVAYVRWTSYPDGSTYGRPRSRSDEPPSTISTHEGTWGWQNPDEIKPVGNDWVLRKYRPDAFIATALDELLRWNKITTIVIVGVGAEVGVVPTLATASSLGYDNVAIRDAIVPTEPDRAEDAMLYIGDHATLLGHTEVIDIWEK